jgi:hypothetical protein
MISGWVVLLVALAVVVATGLAALAGGWRPGRGVKRNGMVVQDEVRDRLRLPVHDWWTVRRAVQRGRAAPEHLRPAAYELADELIGIQRPLPPRRVMVIFVVGLYLVFFALWAVAGGFGWGAVLRPVPTALLGVGLWTGVVRQRARLHRARELNA